ncbi:hypothetical protein GNY06_03455 [Elizabethkingia argentiflava]|uniref:SdpC family antimicrobial peptide n=2 Tax=Elizabethkingia argenteiflava TaxID=2681556 RepID=A0A845PWK2_9FLAO|nr:hypothetical protein [Elizabethkingia argenteiflava]
MKKIRFFMQNKIVLTSFSSIVLLASCSREESPNKEEVQQVTKITGENIFRQIFFLQGGEANVLKSIPTYSYNLEKIEDLSSKEKSASEKYINEIVNILKQNNSNYFNDFESKMKSKDPYIIDQSLKQGAEDIVTAIKNSSEKKRYNSAMKIYKDKYKSASLKTAKDLENLKLNLENDLKKQALVERSQAMMPEAAACLATVSVVAVVAWEVAAAANVVAAVTVFVWKYAKFFGVQESDSSTSSLTNEEVVAAIINNY